jgi:hypothetical protein
LEAIEYTRKIEAATNESQSIPLGGQKCPVDERITIREKHFGEKRKLRVALIEAIISTLSFFKFAEERLDNMDIVCYEKNYDVGGAISFHTLAAGLPKMPIPVSQL